MNGTGFSNVIGAWHTSKIIKLIFYRKIYRKISPDICSPQYPTISCDISYDISPDIADIFGHKYLAIYDKIYRKTYRKI